MGHSIKSAGKHGTTGYKGSSTASYKTNLPSSGSRTKGAGNSIKAHVKSNTDPANGRGKKS